MQRFIICKASHSDNCDETGSIVVYRREFCLPVSSNKHGFYDTFHMILQDLMEVPPESHRFIVDIQDGPIAITDRAWIPSQKIFEADILEKMKDEPGIQLMTRVHVIGGIRHWHPLLIQRTGILVL